MGTVNYKTSDYITMGVAPISVYDVKNDAGLMGDLEELYDAVDDDAISRFIESVYECDYENAKSVLDNHKFYYFDIWLEIGYYEGFSVRIKYNYDGDEFVYFDEKKEAREEIDEIKECLVELADIGLVACSPSWCTSYKNHSGTIAKINEAIDEMKESVRMTNVYKYAWEV